VVKNTGSLESVEKDWKVLKCWMLDSDEAPSPSEKLAEAKLRIKGKAKTMSGETQDTVLKNTGNSVSAGC
jgi:hypothetical protein